jgi:Alginate export
MRSIATIGMALLFGLAVTAGELRADGPPTASAEGAAVAADHSGTDAATPVPESAETETAPPTKAAAQAPEPPPPSGEKATLKISGELKQRGEARRNNDFDAADDGDPRFVGQLIRLKFTGTVAAIGYTVELADGREFGAERKTGSVMATSLVQGYLELGHRTKVRLGRQEITLGEKRLIGSSGWAYRELAAYDGVRFQTEVGRHAFDVFAVKVAEGATTVSDDTGLAALSYTWKGSKMWRPGLYVLFNHEDALDGWSGATDMPIAGAIGTVDLTSAVRLDYEVIFQGGTRRGLKHRARQYHAGLKYTEPGRKRYRLGAEYNLASGDGDPTDGVSRTFDKLYSINHSHYGYIDYQDPRNMRNLRFTLGGKLASSVDGQVDYHVFRLDQARDAWYSRQADVSLQDPTGAAGKDVGTEIDLTAKVDVLETLAVQLGYSRFFSGAFVKTLLGGPAPQPDFGYVQLRVKF